MIKLFDNGAYLLHGTELVEDNAEAGAVLASKLGSAPSKEEASKNTLAYGILAKCLPRRKLHSRPSPTVF